MKKLILLLSVFLLCGSFIGFPVLAHAAEVNLIETANQMNDLGKSGQYEGCIKLADEMLAKDLLIMEAYRNKSNCYFEMGRTREALDTLAEQLKLNHNNQLALYNAACAGAKLGEKDQAINYLKRLLALNISDKIAIRQDSDFNAIRQTPEFQNFIGISVRVGGELLDLDVQPLISEGRTMVPMRAIFEALGAQVSWDGNARTVTANKDGTTIVLTIDKKLSKINGTNKDLDVAPFLKDGRTLVPVRFISEALGAEVNWDADNQLVEILTDKPKGIGADYEAVKKELDNLITVSVVDGLWPEPYNLYATEGMTLIIAKDKKALDLMDSLDDPLRARYMYETAYDNFALVIGCEIVKMKFIYDGKVYYSGDMYSKQEGEGIELTYYSKGLPINVVKQYKGVLDYKDFYQLPIEEQITSQIDD
ncbi:copper amine oxidase N-terminal domain-containing protein [Phosphitispora fastidiosa]|uniref:copper amine oxidase N-terminal domain-containing protein n=1 Tax=Phosphitispora fastidiosa TaxID=2837202 RepID=UPI001E392EB3|nr:copper amine oxidase N-terminal domain-containing protein [Phosphitispora fastidiosa]MBU7005972.1 tetratricopeptide (TPR) repeat protein [Phosphitispora fastidiosa]